MLNFYSSFYEIQKNYKFEFANQLKDNFHKHPKTGYIYDLINEIPQKKFNDVLKALSKMEVDIEKEMSKFTDPDQKKQWMHSILAALDIHNHTYGFDPQQTGNLLRYALRGFMYHEFIENENYLIPPKNVNAFEYIEMQTINHKIHHHPWLLNENNCDQNYKSLEKSNIAATLIKELSFYYKQGLMALGLLLDEKNIDFLGSEVIYFNTENLVKEIELTSVLNSKSLEELSNIFKQMTCYSDIYKNLGALYSMRKVLNTLGENFNLIRDFEIKKNMINENLISQLIIDKLESDENIASAFNSSHRILNSLQKTLESLNKKYW